MHTCYYRQGESWYVMQREDSQQLLLTDVIIKLTSNGNGIFLRGSRSNLEDELKLRKYIPIDCMAKEEMVLIALRATPKPAIFIREPKIDYTSWKKVW
jgi:hypothetical protein